MRSLRIDASVLVMILCDIDTILQIIVDESIFFIEAIDRRVLSCINLTNQFPRISILFSSNIERRPGKTETSGISGLETITFIASCSDLSGGQRAESRGVFVP